MIGIFKTDQVDCYDADGLRAGCSGSGQDGETDAGRPWPQPRFEADALTATDRLSGLMWTRNGSPAEFPLTWEEAFEFVRELNRTSLCGHRDWRLPGRGELFSLVSHAHANPALPRPSPFENVFPGYYWTSSGCSGFENQAWYVHLGGARVFRGMKHGSYMVWPVRNPTALPGNGGAARNSKPGGRTGKNGHLRNDSGGGDACNAARFAVRGRYFDDRLTGLSWLSDPGGGGAHLAVSWQEALERVERLNASGPPGRHTWRLPNIRELESLVDINHHAPALGKGLQSICSMPVGCWSSTTSVYEPRYAWVVYMADGAVGVGFKKRATFSCWAVSES